MRRRDSPTSYNDLPSEVNLRKGSFNPNSIISVSARRSGTDRPTELALALGLWISRSSGTMLKSPQMHRFGNLSIAILRYSCSSLSHFSLYSYFSLPTSEPLGTYTQMMQISSIIPAMTTFLFVKDTCGFVAENGGESGADLR